MAIAEEFTSFLRVKLTRCTSSCSTCIHSEEFLNPLTSGKINQRVTDVTSQMACFFLMLLCRVMPAEGDHRPERVTLPAPHVPFWRHGNCDRNHGIQDWFVLFWDRYADLQKSQMSRRAAPLASRNSYYSRYR